MKKNDLHFTLQVTLIKQGRQTVAYSPALDISTAGKDIKQALNRFSELVEIFFEELELSGNTETVLRELGWTKQRKIWSPPEIMNSRPMPFNFSVKV